MKIIVAIIIFLSFAACVSAKTCSDAALAAALSIKGCKGAWIFNSSSTIRDFSGNNGNAQLYSGGNPPTSWSQDEYGGSFNMHGVNDNGIVVPPGKALHCPYFTIVMTLKPSSVIDFRSVPNNGNNKNLFYIPYTTYGGDGQSLVSLTVYNDSDAANTPFVDKPGCHRALSFFVMPSPSAGIAVNSNGYYVTQGYQHTTVGYIPGANPQCFLPRSIYPVTLMCSFDSKGFTFRIKSKDDYQTSFIPADIAWKYFTDSPRQFTGIQYSGDTIANLNSAEWSRDKLGGAMIDNCYNTFFFDSTLTEKQFLSIANSYYKR